MNPHNQFYAQTTSDPTSINKSKAIGKFSVFLDEVVASFKHDANPAALVAARVDLESALLSLIAARVHADYRLECYCLLGDELSAIAAYCHAMAGNPIAASHPDHEG